mgnify:CR=1 FL=1
MKNLVTSLLAIAFVIVGSNIANMAGYMPPTNLQTVAASTVPQLPLSSILNNNMNRANPDTVHDTVPVPCNHQSQTVKTVIKTKIVEKNGISSLPLLYIATPVEGDSVDYAYNVHKVSE